MNIFVIALEPIESRYTCQWFDGFPKLLEDEAKNRTSTPVNVINVPGNETNNETTEGAFLDFLSTNIWKNDQMTKVAKYFQNGDVKTGDQFIFADAWHPGIIQLKYMSELTETPVKIHSIWHAGSYDPQDFLGRKITNKDWTFNFERSAFWASDQNYFATDFHVSLLYNSLFKGNMDFIEKVSVSGQPHNVLVETLEKDYESFTNLDGVKQNIILFPHRIAPEKQVDIFKDLAKALPKYEFIVCQEKKLSKSEYHELLCKSKMVFSANLQETLGISAMEGVLVDAIPFVPNRLSYTEMYMGDFKYPSGWTASWQDYIDNKKDIVHSIRFMMDYYDNFKVQLEQQKAVLKREYLYPGQMLKKLFN